MRSLLLCLGVCAGTLPAAGQVTARLSVGATSSTSLVHDGVLGIALRPAIAPTLSAAIAIPTGKGPYRVVFEGSYARSSLNVTDVFGKDQVGSEATLTALVFGEGPLRGALRWQLGGGAIRYHPAERAGVFRDGGTTRWILAGGLTWTHQLSGAMDLLVTGRVDTHEFNTSTLRADGYSGYQSVQRFALLVGVTRRL